MVNNQELTASGQYPFVSVILPVRNERNFIEKNLRSILAQDYPANRYEIIVIDGQSDDGTVEIIQSLAAHYPGRIQVLENTRHITPCGLNLGICKAQGELICPVNGHCVLEPDYLSRAVEASLRTGADNVGGRMRATNKGYVAAAIALATNTPFAVGNSKFHYSDREEYVDTVYLGCYRREVFDRIGLFDEELVRNQDDELNYRLVASGGRILLSPAIKSLYFGRQTLSQLFSQYYQYGFYKIRVMQKQPAMIKARHLVPATFVSSLLLSLLVALLNFRLLWRLPALVFGPYAGVMFYGSVKISARHGWKFLPVLPLAFASVHFGYGMGCLKGFWVHRNRWQEVYAA